MTTNQNFPNDFLKMWQKGIQDYMQDAKTAELASDYFLKFQDNYNSMMSKYAQTSTSKFHDDGAQRDEQHITLSTRVEQLEARVTELEELLSRLAPKSKKSAA